MELSEREKHVGRMREIVERMLLDLDGGKIPSLKVPIRHASNTNYDPDEMKLWLGGRVLERSPDNTKQVHVYSQTLSVMSEIKSAIEQGLYPSTRDVFYNLKKTISANSKLLLAEEQSETDEVIHDIEVLSGVFREQFGLTTWQAKSVIMGDLTVRDRATGKTINVKDHTLTGQGFNLPLLWDSLELVGTNARFVLIVEKGAIFISLFLQKWWEKNGAIIMTSGGEPDRVGRRFIKRLHDELKLPVFTVVDADPWGWTISSVYRIGSIRLSHEGDNLACPDIQFLGMSCSDIYDYKVQDLTARATDADLKRASEMKDYPWFQTPFWQKEISLFLDKKLKAELESLNKRYTFFADKYLIDKLKSAGVI